MKDELITLRINKNDKKRFKKLCDKKGYSISEVLLDFIKTSIRNESLEMKNNK